MRKVYPFHSLLLPAMILFLPGFTRAQSASNTLKLQAFAIEKRIQSEAMKARALLYAAQHNIPPRIESKNGYTELVDVTSTGIPQYYTTTNLTAAKTISTHDVRCTAVHGIIPDGRGIIIGQWDAGHALATHTEFSGRLVYGDEGAVHFHATHIAGTMAAAGINGKAQGMAPGAAVKSYEWNNDLSEMAEAASEGILLANCSYGMVRGWATDGNNWYWYGDTAISRDEDYMFGYYDERSHDMDELGYEAPYFLAVRSAGNDRNEGPDGGIHPKDGPWDCINPSAVAKNILTVGAVDDLAAGYSAPGQVRMTAYSGWGPVDDGRIKPDIVANGVGLFSAGNTDSSYITLSGTSMAAASVTGSLALLQDTYNLLFGHYMKAATLKALVIHTADEAGNDPGPDYRFGWGLMNTASAEQVILQDTTGEVILETQVTQGETYRKTIHANGKEPLKVTLVWTDLPGTPVAPSLDPATSMLVNDLDLAVSSGNEIFYPWKLDPAVPDAPATRDCRNAVDNVEVVEADAPEKGDYTITVSCNGSLAGGAQPFSLVITGTRVIPEDQKDTTGGSADLRKIIEVYPNPASDQVTIRKETEEPAHIVFFTLTGEIVQEATTTGSTHRMDVSGLRQGLYIIRISTATETRYTKLFRE